MTSESRPIPFSTAYPKPLPSHQESGGFVFRPAVLIRRRYGHIGRRHGEAIGTTSEVCQGNGVARTVDGIVGSAARQGHGDGSSSYSVQVVSSVKDDLY